MNIPVDVIATFNTKGKIRPNYIRLEDEEHALHTYKIECIEWSKEERFAGNKSIVFWCYIMMKDSRKNIKLSYQIDANIWMIFNNKL